MTAGRACVDCQAPVKLRDRQRCHACHRRSERAALKRACSSCAQLRHLRPDGRCAGCVRATTPPKPPKLTACLRCGENRRNVGHGLCNRCALADPDGPFRYAASLAGRLRPAPPWWDGLLEFAAARYHPGGAIIVLRETGWQLLTDPAVTPRHLMGLTSPQLSPTTGRALNAFFTSHGLALPSDAPSRRAAARREHYLAAITGGLGSAVADFNDTQITEQDRRRRTGRRTLADSTLAARLRILRNLAAHLRAGREVTGWAEITTADLESFLARTPAARHQQTYVLRRFFAWSKARKVILTNPASALSLGAQPAFTGVVLDTAAQRRLFHRWTRTTTPAHERLTGLLALLHAASNSEIRTLRVTDVNTKPGTSRSPAARSRPHWTPPPGRRCKPASPPATPNEPSTRTSSSPA